MMMVNEDIINDIDTKQRYEEEWCQIYHVRMASDCVVNTKPFDEFEWAYIMSTNNYYKLPSRGNNYDIADSMEMRAQKIYRDIYASADRQEKQLLRSGSFVATDYILNYRLKHG